MNSHIHHRHLVTLAALTAGLLAATPSHAQLSLSWLTQYGSSNTDAARAIEVDASGQSWVAGHTFGNIGGVNPNPGTWDVFLSRVSPTGVVDFTQQRGSTGHDGAYGLALVGGSSVFTGGFSDSPTFDGATALGGSGNDALSVRYNTSGTWQNTTRFGTTTDDLIYALAGNSTHLLAAGYTNGSFDGQTYLGNQAAFLSKRDSTGASVWTRFAQATGETAAAAVGFDSGGSGYISGYTLGNFSGFTNAGDRDIFVARYDSLGNQTLLKQYGGTGNDTVLDLEVDASGNIYLVGDTISPTLNGQTSNGQNDIFVMKLDSSGNHLWTRLLGGSGGDSGIALGLDVAGRVWVAGNSGSNFAGHINNGLSLDAVVARYDSTGNLLETPLFLATTISDAYDVITGLDVRFDGSDSVAYVTGYTDGALTGSNLGSFDNFVAKIVPEPSTAALLGGSGIALLLRRRPTQDTSRKT